MNTLLEINAQTFIHFTVILSSFTILTCYSLAQYYNHVNTWLPMISDCFVYPPESYISRFGVISFINCGSFVSNILIAKYNALNTSYYKLLVALAFITSISFGYVGAISEEDNLFIHNVFAFSGYISYGIYLWILFIYSKFKEDKPFLCVVYTTLLYCKLNTVKPLIEWLLTITYAINMYTYGSELQNEYILLQ